ncbi:MAG TPA: ferredoxin reductase family protein [Solirubrobacteraceae bacterium]|jgi:predicted ferric reductase|nr:ferredoxin reductase family protein [Solirubrobacteraceae bacterium]
MENSVVAPSSGAELSAGLDKAVRGQPARLAAGAILAGVGSVNVVVIVALWLRAGGMADVGSTADAFTSAGRLTALLGAYLALVAVVLLARVPVLERVAGFDRLTGWHRHAARACLTLLLAHTALTTAGLTLGDGVSLPREAVRLITQYPGVITAVAGLALFVAVAATSAVIVRRRLRYETWYFVHLYTYLAIALAFSHQIATGRDFVGDPAARAYWIALYAVTLGALVLFRIAAPLARGARHRLRVARVVEEAPGVVSIEIAGARLERLRARPGQFFLWRFLTSGRWWQAHPFSLSAAPDGRRLRITVKDSGDFSSGLRLLQPGTRVLAEGPFGAFTAEARRRRRVVLIAGGAGITPIRALLETMPAEPGDIALVYRAPSAGELVFREEIEALAGARGAELHYAIGDACDLSGDALARLIPDIAERDAFVCGPPGMVEATRGSLLAAGMPKRHIFTERFAF